MSALVVDSSVVVTALVDDDDVSTWAEDLLTGEVSAPHLMPVEVAHVLRRMEGKADVSSAVASLAHRDLLTLRIETFPYAAFGRRVWELRHTVTAYDAWYVALAEDLGVPLATLDGRLTRAPGPRCAFLTPPV